MRDQANKQQPEHIPFERTGNKRFGAGYQLWVSRTTEDPVWDAFVANTPGGHHTQTSLWAQIKTLLNWRASRIMLVQNERIVAGAQLLMHPLMRVGMLGYVPQGPLVAVDDPLLVPLVIDALHQVAKAQRVQYLVMQPPHNGDSIAAQLPALGFRPSSTQITPTATVVLDLQDDVDTVFSRIKGKTRQNIRRGQRRGVVVREGSERDLPAYYRLVIATSQRKNFLVYPEAYFVNMWRVLSPHSYIKLFLAEYEGELVSAQLAIPFGNTVVNRLSVWSGRYAEHRPNEVLQWAAIMWAKQHGYRYYDFEGITQQAAQAVLRGEPLPDSLMQSVTSFKLGFGGQVALYPQAYDYVYNPLLRYGYNTVFPKIEHSSAVKKVRNWLRTR